MIPGYVPEEKEHLYPLRRDERGVRPGFYDDDPPPASEEPAVEPEPEAEPVTRGRRKGAGE